jgi:succinyl-CoA synthetase alpha subunit
MRQHGTEIAAGVAPGRGGSNVDGIPVFDTVVEAVEATGARTSVAFLPPHAARDGIVEAAEARIQFLVSVTEGIPLHDLLEAFEVADQVGMRILGPNCPGMLSCGEYLLGFLPAGIVAPGSCAVISRSGTLSYEAVHALGGTGLGISLWIGVGGDYVKGMTFADVLPEVRADPRTEVVLIVGEIGGTDEQDAAEVLERMSMPAVALLAGASAPPGTPIGHAGAIVEGATGTYAAKSERFARAGVAVVQRPSQLPAALRGALARSS